MKEARNLNPSKTMAGFKTRMRGTKTLARKDFPQGRGMQEGGRRSRQKKEGQESQEVQELQEELHIVVETPVIIPYTREYVVKR